MSTSCFAGNEEEIALVDRCRRQEAGAYDDFCDRYGETIRRIALRILKDQTAAEDAVQETLINVFRAIGRFRGDSRISTWLNRIATNVCLEILRRDKRRKEDSFEVLQEVLVDSLVHADSPFDFVYRREVGSRLEFSLGRVSPKQRQIIKMHDVEGRTIKEIAQLLNISQGTVKSRLFYGRQECRRHLNRLERIH
ncbi:MAG: RNA polymerase sigma factor [Acidobacteria bacterium]|nr:RNA polymerase sigma factor [Acidobacteriota bacterium]